VLSNYNCYPEHTGQKEVRGGKVGSYLGDHGIGLKEDRVEGECGNEAREKEDYDGHDFLEYRFYLSASNIFCCNVWFGSMEYELGRRKLDS